MPLPRQCAKRGGAPQHQAKDTRKETRQAQEKLRRTEGKMVLR